MTQRQDTLFRVTELQDADQDFEWYPTTDAMIKVVFDNMGDCSSVLDIGAGDGRVLDKIDRLKFYKYADNHNKTFSSQIKKYAIEKSMIHIKNMPANVSIVGTDFMLQTLIDKKVDVVFCNPPYSEFEEWAVKVIKEANAKDIFLILPGRWAKSKLIEKAIKQRSAVSRVVWSGDFKAGDRPARAFVDIVKIHITSADRDYEREKHGPFNTWFDEYFGDFAKIEPVKDEVSDEDEEKVDPFKQIAKGDNLIDHLYKFYVDEMNMLLNNYKSLSQLDATLLKELGVEVDSIKEALKQKIGGVKNKYWKELFDNLDKINSRLTSGSRCSMLEKMRKSCNVDFSIENAYAIVLWVIKNANEYIDQQLIEMFKDLSEPECVKNYKSNQRTWERGDWRYQHKDKHSHYMLEYRIITSKSRAVKPSNDEFGWHYENNLYKDTHAFINDIFTIANNLGFSTGEGTYSRYWESGSKQSFGTTDKRILVEIRAFMNGNLHLRFHQDFIKTLNVEASRLLGWIRSPQQVVDEMGYDVDFAKSCFKTNLLFGISDGKKLLTAGKC